MEDLPIWTSLQVDLFRPIQSAIQQHLPILWSTKVHLNESQLISTSERS